MKAYAEEQTTLAENNITEANRKKAEADKLIAEAEVEEKEAVRLKKEAYFYEETWNVSREGSTIPIIEDQLIDSIILGKVLRQTTQVHVANDVTTIILTQKRTVYVYNGTITYSDWETVDEKKETNRVRL